jgi:hypothetical protein
MISGCGSLRIIVLSSHKPLSVFIHNDAFAKVSHLHDFFVPNKKDGIIMV